MKLRYLWLILLLIVAQGVTVSAQEGNGPFETASIELSPANARPPITDLQGQLSAMPGGGEPYFRDGERRVIARLLNEGPCVLATGGGAFMDPRTREALSRTAVTIWLRADLATLIQRIARRNNRPLMRTADPAAQVERLLALRVPTYSLADIAVDSSDRPHDEVVATLMGALCAHLQGTPRPRVAL